LAVEATQERSLRKPIRILQIIENLDTGAVENWLFRMFAASNVNGNDNFHWTFFCTLGKPGRLDDQVRALGGEILYSPVEIGNKRAFFDHLRNVMKQGSYDILHCHHDFVSAVYLWAALGLPIRKRIVHVHNTDEGLLTPGRIKQFILKEPMRQTCLRLADNVVGISKETLTKFTRNANSRERDRVVYYAIDTARFHELTYTREEFRSNLGFLPNAKVLLFVGRMAPLKNPLFMVEVLAELAKTDDSIVAIFAGAGELESRVKDLAEEKGIGDKVKILGWRDDTATLMRLSDVLVFPRLEKPKEGFGLVLVEAQAAGLPIVASPSITEDVQVIPELFDIVPLAAGPRVWAQAVSRSLSRRDISRDNCLARIESSSFSMDRALNSLLALYSDLVSA
jgi:glycosyltransferase involved in cell wall biosynthesis